MPKDIKRLAMDTYHGVATTFTKADGSVISADDALRGLLLEKCGGTWSRRNFRKIENEFYEILEEMVTEVTSTLTREAFSQIMTFKDVALGEKVEFYVDDDKLFDVSVISNGNNNLFRQRIINRKVPTTGFTLGIKMYDDIEPFMMGRTNWNKAIDKVVKSFQHKIGELIAQTFAKAYDNITDTNLKVTGTMDEAKLLELVEKVGDGAVIYGSKIALSKIPSIEGFVGDATDVKNGGFVKKFKGVDCVELSNYYNSGSNSFALPNDILYIIPDGNKILFGGFEGDAYILDDTTGTSRLDRQIEYLYSRTFHLGIAVASRYGAYKIS